MGVTGSARPVRRRREITFHKSKERLTGNLKALKDPEVRIAEIDVFTSQVATCGSLSTSRTPPCALNGGRSVTTQVIFHMCGRARSSIHWISHSDLIQLSPFSFRSYLILP